MIFEKEETPRINITDLQNISLSHTLRCDAKQAENRFSEFNNFITSVDYFFLGDFFPDTFVKGKQPSYIDSFGEYGVPVINTLSIQNLRINLEDCRYLSEDDFGELPDKYKCKKGDILLTVDGGTSIGKPVLFNFDEDFTVDSHVIIMRPDGLDPKVIVYLLASPLGQIQFNQAESGASGQTSVTEEEIRRFRFPIIPADRLLKIVEDLDLKRKKFQEEIEQIEKREREEWINFVDYLVQ